MGLKAICEINLHLSGHSDCVNTFFLLLISVLIDELDIINIYTICMICDCIYSVTVVSDVYFTIKGRTTLSGLIMKHEYKVMWNENLEYIFVAEITSEFLIFTHAYKFLLQCDPLSLSLDVCKGHKSWKEINPWKCFPLLTF
jgi:hypothetical protein